MEIVQMRLADLKPYENNPRKNDTAIPKMVKAFTEFGFRIPILAKSDGEIIDGHLRYKAAQKMGLESVPVILADDMSEAQIRAFRIAVNKSAEWANWDDQLLLKELQALQQAGFDLELTGFSRQELKLFEKLGDADDKYVIKDATPIYEPTGADISLEKCFITEKYNDLLAEIDASGLAKNEKEFLRLAASRHITFNYQNIAEYYANKASAKMQRLMERSALVIIDMNHAIEQGYVEFGEKLQEIISMVDDDAA